MRWEHGTTHRRRMQSLSSSLLFRQIQSGALARDYVWIPFRKFRWQIVSACKWTMYGARTSNAQHSHFEIRNEAHWLQRTDKKWIWLSPWKSSEKLLAAGNNEKPLRKAVTAKAATAATAEAHHTHTHTPFPSSFAILHLDMDFVHKCARPPHTTDSTIFSSVPKSRYSSSEMDFFSRARM